MAKNLIELFFAKDLIELLIARHPMGWPKDGEGSDPNCSLPRTRRVGLLSNPPHR